MANEGSLTLTADMVTLVVSLLVSATIKVSVWPTSTLPNRRTEGERISWGAIAKAFRAPKANSRTVPILVMGTENAESSRMGEWGSRTQESVQDSAAWR